MKTLKLSLIAAMMLLSTTSAIAGEFALELYIPAAGRVSGAGGSEFYTALWITNPSEQEAAVSVEFIPTGNTPGERPDFQVTVGPESTVYFENVTQDQMNAAGTLGALRIQSNRAVTAAARVYNLYSGQTPAQSTGVFFNAVPSSRGVKAGERVLLQGVRQDNDFRYNVFLQEVSGLGAKVILQLRNGETGIAFGFREYELSGFEHKFLNVAELADVTTSNAVVYITVSHDAPGRVVAVGSLTANVSQDPTGFEPSEPF